MIATWAPVVFWVLLIPLLIVMLIVYLRSKQFYRLVYIVSVFTYAMMVMYWIDSYKLGRNAIVGLLVASSLLMIYLGWHMHKVKLKKSSKNVKLAIGSIAIIAIIVAISAAPIGWTIEKSHAASLRMSEIMPIIEEGKPTYTTPGVPVATITVTNTWIPRQYELPQPNGCLYNSEQNAYQWASLQWDLQGQQSDFGPSYNTIEISRETKTANLKLMQSPQFRPVPEMAKPVKFEPQVYDQLLLWLDSDKGYIDCYNIQPADRAKAIVISITQD